MKKYVDTNMLESSLSNKKDCPAKVTSFESTLLLQDNVEYRLNDVTTLTLSYPNTEFESWLIISCATNGTIAIELPASTKYIGAAPDFGNGQTWEISIKDCVAICWRVE